MRRLFISAIISAGCLSGAIVFRIDPLPVMTTAGNAPVGGFPALYAVAGATISICTDAACSIPAQTYTDATGATPCPINAPVTLARTAICSNATGPQGQFGFWVPTGTYYYNVMFPDGSMYGPFPVTVDISRLPNPTGTIVVVYDGVISTVFKQDGTLLPIPGSVTSGLQEAFSYASTNGYNVEVHGKSGVPIPVHGMLHLPPTHDFTIRFDSAIDFPDTGAYDGLWIDSARTGRYEFNGAITYAGSQDAVKVYGHNPDPVDGINQVDGNYISFTNITCSVNTWSGTMPCQNMLHLLGDNSHAGYGNVSHNHIAATSLVGGAKGLLMESAALNDRGSVQENQVIEISQIVYQSAWGVYIQDGANGTIVNNNPAINIGVIWNAYPVRGGSGIYIGSSGQTNHFHVGNISATGGNAVQYAGGAGSNVVDVGSYQGSLVQTIYNLSNLVNVPVVPTEQSITVPPYVSGPDAVYDWYNPYPFDIFVSVIGGNVSNLQLSVDRSLFYNIGGNWIGSGSAVTPMPVGSVIRMTYNYAPQLYVFAKK